MNSLTIGARESNSIRAAFPSWELSSGRLNVGFEHR